MLLVNFVSAGMYSMAYSSADYGSSVVSEGGQIDGLSSLGYVLTLIEDVGSDHKSKGE